MMTLTYPQEISDGHGGLVKASSLTHLAVGTMVSSDLDAAQKFYEGFLGLETVRTAPDRMFLRDRRAKHLMENGERDFFVIEVHQVAKVEKPQTFFNHWGISVGTREEVERIRELANAEKDNWYIKRVGPITGIHESHGFMIVDNDDNWWEIEHRGGITNDVIFSRGDFDNRSTDESKMVNPPLGISVTKAVVVGPEAFMTHGTVDVVNIVNSRGFYEEVLGLRSVLRFDNSQFTSGGGDFTFVGVQAPANRIGDQNADNRWILLVKDEKELAARHANALQLKDRFGIRDVTQPVRHKDGSLSFLVKSADSNWFELSTRSREAYAGVFKQLKAA